MATKKLSAKRTRRTGARRAHPGHKNRTHKESFFWPSRVPRHVTPTLL